MNKVLSLKRREEAMKQAVLVKIYAVWKKEANVWVASSSDIYGVETEAKTLMALEEKLNQIIPDLLQLNGIDGKTALIVNCA